MNKKYNLIYAILIFFVGVFSIIYGGHKSMFLTAPTLGSLLANSIHELWLSDSSLRFKKYNYCNLAFSIIAIANYFYCGYITSYNYLFYIILGALIGLQLIIYIKKKDVI